MPQANASLEGLTKEATILLSASQQNLQALADRLHQYLKTSAASENNGHRSSIVGLHYLYEQTNQLLSQSKTLNELLDDNLNGYLPDSQLLSRVQIFQRQEEERARTARELERTIGQAIANAIFELAAVKQLIAIEDDLNLVMDGIAALQQELETSLTDLRLLIAELEPNTMLGNFGLVAGLRRYMEKFTEQTEIETDLQVQTLIEPLPSIIEVSIFRIIQEALQNTKQHATASKVGVTISEENGHLKFCISDNGTGLTIDLTDSEQRQLGLVSMKEVADLLNGHLQLKSEKDIGTQIILTIPNPRF